MCVEINEHDTNDYHNFKINYQEHAVGRGTAPQAATGRSELTLVSERRKRLER